MSAPVELTKITKDSGAVTKRVHLNPDGSIGNDSSRCAIGKGRMTRLHLPDWRDFKEMLEATPRNTAYALGALRPGLPDSVQLVRKRDPQSAQPGVATRTADAILYREKCPGFALLDFDTKGMPPGVKTRLQDLGGFRGALGGVCPGFAAAGHIRRRSTSAGVINELTGESYQSDGQHLYVLVRDGAAAQRFLYALHDRCWLMGLGWYLVGKAGQLLERSIVDRMVCAPERLVFEADPDLEPPLRQDRREAVVHDGTSLDTLAECPDLNSAEKAELTQRQAEAARDLDKECGAAREAFISVHVEKAVARGMDRDKARTMAEQWGKGILRPGAILEFDELGAIPVADVLADLAQFDGETLADPIEGIAYGRNCAIVQARDGTPSIFSFAHGGAIYKIKHDYESVRTAILAVEKNEGVRVYSRLAPEADLDPIETKRLAKLAGERSGEGVKVAEQMLKQAREQQRREAAHAVRAKKAAESTRIRIDEIPPDAEIGPVMKLLDDTLSSVAAAEPPMRDAEGCPVEVTCRETAGLHELTATGANDAEDEKSRLPPPKNFLLTRLDNESLEILIGDHIAFIRETMDGERSVAPPTKFLIHYLKYRRSKLPRAHAVQTMPLVLPDSALLARNGLDRERRAVFRINQALLPFVPKTEDCTEAAVDEAFKFLRDEWLADVATSIEGKCALIALAMTVIERILLPSRPVFFVTAGLRGGGKTTALMMIALAATGIKAAAAAWSSDPNERKKAIFAYLLEALPLLVWDNIPRGTMISCSHIERASTAETYQDRVLGENRAPVAPAFTIMAFTGNNIGPKSDQSSRSLEVRLTTDRCDPENREFKHPDPIGWTRDHRGKILGALYTILLGNPQFKERRPAETRFKEWWNLIGSAVEYANNEAPKKPGPHISFMQMFARTEAKDEDAIERADIIQTLYAIKGDAEFTAVSLHEHLAKSASGAELGKPEEPGAVELRRFCTSPRAKAPSPKSISHALQAIVDAPVAVLAGTAFLRSSVNTDTKQRRFSIKITPAG